MTDPPPTLVAIALGSNLGDRRATLGAAVEALGALLDDIAVSRLRETDPIGVAGPQPRYLNAAVVGAFDGTARELLDALQALERRLGRTRPFPNAPRTLDLDLILFGNLVCASEALEVPHPRFRSRRFVLEPLAEIAPTLRDPVTGLTVAELLART